MSITIKGVLARDAEVRRWLTGDAVVILTITAACGASTPFEVRLPITGQIEDPMLAGERLAAGWHRGCTVTVEATRLEYRADHGVATFVLRDLVRLVIDERVAL